MRNFYLVILSACLSITAYAQSTCPSNEIQNVNIVNQTTTNLLVMPEYRSSGGVTYISVSRDSTGTMTNVPITYNGADNTIIVTNASSNATICNIKVPTTASSISTFQITVVATDKGDANCDAQSTPCS